MKKIMMPYLLAYFFLFVSYFLVSFIMAVLLSFMHISSFVYNILLIIMNYFLLSVFTLFFFKNVKEKPWIHGLIFPFIYLIIQIIFHFQEFKFTLLKSLWLLFFIFYFIYKEKTTINVVFYTVNSISTILTSYASATPTVTISLTP